MRASPRRGRLSFSAGGHSGQNRIQHAARLSHTTWVVYLLWSTDMLNPVQRAVGANLLKLANPNRDVLLL